MSHADGMLKAEFATLASLKKSRRVAGNSCSTITIPLLRTVYGRVERPDPAPEVAHGVLEAPVVGHPEGVDQAPGVGASQPTFEEEVKKK